jgi:hypothetical protein
MGYDIGPRKFNGELYRIADTFTRKAEAKKKVDALHNQGYKARVVFYSGPRVYVAYRGPRR